METATRTRFSLKKAPEIKAFPALNIRRCAAVWQSPPSACDLRDGIDTSGGAFPAGLVVGTITDVRTEAGGQQTYGVITPACDLGELLQVFVIKDFDVVS